MHRLHHFGVGVEVDVALAVAGLGVGQAVVLAGGQGQRLGGDAVGGGGFGDVKAFPRPDRDFAGLGGAQRAAGGDQVAVVGHLRQAEVGLADGLLRHGDLHVARVVAQRQEDQVAHDAVLHHPAGHGDDGAGVFRRRGVFGRFEGFVGRGVVAAAGLGDVDQSLGALTVGVEAELVAEPLEFVPAVAEELILRFFGFSGVDVGHGVVDGNRRG